MANGETAGTGRLPRLEVHMFGGFTASYGERPITFGRGGTGKSVQLFQLLLLHQKSGIAKERLMQDLYDWDTVTDRNNSLNSVIYRLKKQLVSAGMPKEDYISLKNGICRWCGSMETYVDTADMEELAARASERSGQEQIDLLERACALYTGEFLPHLSGEIWVTAESLRLKQIYGTAVRRLCGLLEARGEFRRACHYYAKAAALYPYEEWQAGQIGSLLEMGRYEEAHRLYLETEKLYLDELGLPPSDAMLARLRRMSGRLSGRESGLSKARQLMAEGHLAEGAYYCSYPSFVDFYRIVCRQAERGGQPARLMMCGLRGGASERRDKEACDVLLSVIGRVLCRDDVYTRYSGRQFLILLPGRRKENGAIIYRRICDEFFRVYRGGRCRLWYETAAAGGEPGGEAADI